MSFRINTNIAAMQALNTSTLNNKKLDSSLESLSSGLRINSAADDASGLAIANSLGAQANGLNQAIDNANDGVSVVQTADGALDEYTNIINTVRTKAIQAASDGQNDDSRAAIQNDIAALLEEAQNIASTTSFNGQNLLDGSFTNKNFQIGAYANQTVGISIDDAQIYSIGQYAEGTNDTALTGNAFVDDDLVLNGTDIKAAGAGTDNALAQATDSAWHIAESVNDLSATTGVTATASTTLTGVNDVVGGAFTAGDVYLNGIDLGDVTFSSSDSTGALVTAINKITDQTFVTASVEGGNLTLESLNGENITLSTTSGGGTVAAVADMNMLGFAQNSTTVGTAVYVNGSTTATAVAEQTWGEVTLESADNILIGAGTTANSGFTNNSTIGLANALSSVDVTTYDGAQKAIKQADYALSEIDSIRSNIGSTQNQLESTIRNISVTAVNVTAAESQIRDVDFAEESSNFSKYNILAQSGTYALSQANSVQQNVLTLLQ